jgi:hypothetical protein
VYHVHITTARGSYQYDLYTPLFNSHTVQERSTMTRRTLLSTLAAVIVGLVMAFTANTTEAVAQQNPNCCNYFIDVAGVPATCFRIQVWTRWSIGVIGPDVIAANGLYVYPVPGLCPPAANFVGASLAGPGGPYATFNNPVHFIVNGCCMIVRIAFDVNGCPYIYVRPC